MSQIFESKTDRFKSRFFPISRLKLKMQMFHELAALTLPVVSRGIDHVLEDDPEHPYHLAFAMPELRQKLIDHILNNVPNSYAVKAAQKPFQARQPCVLQERIWLEMVVRGSILHVLRENTDWLRRHAL